MTIKHAFFRFFRSRFAFAAILVAFARISFAQTTAPLLAANAVAQTQNGIAEPLPILTSSSLKYLAPVFPVLGLIAAAWATHHVRRRNARQLAATR